MKSRCHGKLKTKKTCKAKIAPILVAKSRLNDEVASHEQNTKRSTSITYVKL
jgi:hypothetical protein